MMVYSRSLVRLGAKFHLEESKALSRYTRQASKLAQSSGIPTAARSWMKCTGFVIRLKSGFLGSTK